MAARHIHDALHDRHAPREPSSPSSHAERAATWLSLACAVHCLVMPLAMSVMPLLGASGITQLGPTAEHVMTLLVVASAVLGVVWGYRRHHDVRFVYATIAGLCAYLVGHAFEGSWYGVLLAVLGALTLAISSFSSARVSHAHTHSEADQVCTH
jgi:hypothetical protein